MKTIKIAHIAIWTQDLEKMKLFYETYFGFRSGAKYINPAKGFSSYFLGSNGTCKVELMHSVRMESGKMKDQLITPGYAHIAFSLGSKEAVDSMTNRLESDGFQKLDGPRITGDGYYESVFLDPEKNILEITI
jgi:lactoylglutathione lyase